MESKPPDAAAASIPALLDQLWVKFLPQLKERVSVLERAVAALEKGGLSSDLRAQARSAAHKLAGSLGTFGLQQGTAMAREAEGLLAGESPLDPPSGKRLVVIAAELHTVVLARSASQLRQCR